MQRTNRPNAHKREPRTFAFGSWQLNVETGELLQDGVVTSLAPQSFALLAYLLEHRDRALSSNELLTEVWPDAVVGEGSLRLAVHEIRKTLRDTGAEQTYVRTMRGKGYRFVAPVLASAAPLSGTSAEAAVLGRARECAQIDATLEGSWRGARAFCVVGPQGMGKSHLLRYANQRALQLGFTTATGHAGESRHVQSLAPWTELLTKLFAQLGRGRRALCQRRAPAAYAALVDGKALPTEWLSLPGFEGQHAWVLDELTRLVEAIAEDGPLALFLEDMQQAQEASLELLVHLTTRASCPPIALFVSCREPTAGQSRALRRALKQLASTSASLRIDLTSLPPEATLELLSSAAPTLDESLMQEVHELSGGNPMFALELARLLVQLGSAGANALRTLEGGTGDVVRRRLEMLNPETLRALLAASVLPLDFGMAQLAHLLKTTPRHTLALIEEAERQGIVRAASTQYRASFAHSLLRERANAMLAPHERSDLHLLAAEWLEDVEADESRTLPQLAHHFHAAATSGGAKKAVSYARRCAEQSLQTGSFREAAAFLERALACCDLIGMSPLERLRLELERAEAERLAAPASAALHDTIAALAERARTLGAAELFVKAVLVYTGQTASRFAPARFTASTDRREIELVERALAETCEPCAERALLLCALAFALVYTTSDQRRIAACEEATAIARSLSQPWLLARTLMMRSFLCAAPSDYEQRLASCSELIDLLGLHGFQELEIEARLRRALCLLEGGDRRAAERDEVRVTQLAQLLSSPRLRVRSELPALLRAFDHGHLERARQMSEQALAAQPNDATARSIYLVRLASIHNLGRGMSTELLAMHEDLVRTHPDTIGFRCSLASIYAASGRHEEAGAQFDWVAREHFACLPKNLNWLSELSLLADTAVSLDDPERARRAYAALAPYGQRWLIFAGEGASGGPVAYWLCNLASTMRAYDAGKRWLAHARELVTLMQAPLFSKFADLAEARLLLACRVPGESPRAAALLRTVTSFADQHNIRCLRLCAEDIAARYASWPRDERTLPSEGLRQ